MLTFVLAVPAPGRRAACARRSLHSPPRPPPRYLTLAQAQAKRFVVDWADPANAPVRPRVLGTKSFESYPIEDVVDYIDWNPFFQVGG